MAEVRYTLHAYVCGASCVRWSQHMGQMTFRQIFIERPDGCRYAVASQTPDKVLVWDLYHVQPYPAGGFTTPRPVHVAVTIDAAVMQTAMLYDQE